MNTRWVLGAGLACQLWLVSTYGASASSAGVTNSANVPIPDGGTWVASSITISGLPDDALVIAIDVSFACVHPDSGDLVVELWADEQQLLGTARLWDREGVGSSDPARTSNGITTFNGLTARRRWNLVARDEVAGQVGYIDEWTLTVHYLDPRCDVVVEGVPGVTPNPVAPGQSISVSYTIGNHGGSAADASETKIQIKDSLGAVVTEETFPDPPIDAGGSEQRIASVAIPPGTPAGTLTAFVILDNQNALDQSNTDNDISAGVGLTVDGSRCDVVVEGIPEPASHAVMAGQSLLVEYTIRSNGPGPAESTESSVELHDLSGKLLAGAAVAMPALGVGETITQSASVPVPAGATPGACVLRVTADHPQLLSQTSRVNDRSAPALVSVLPAGSSPGGFDFAADGPPAVDPAVVAPGGFLNVRFALRNGGDAPSPPAMVMVELLDALGETITARPVAVGGIPAESSAGPFSVNLQVPASAPGGAACARYFVVARGVPQQNHGNDYSPPQPVLVRSPAPGATAELVEGIDVSRHEGAIDWDAVRLAGKEFAYIKASEGGTVEGYEMHPAHFAGNWPAAVAAGVVVGAYHFANPLRSPEWHDSSWSEPPGTPRDEAARFIESALPALGPGFLPPGLDVEPHAVSYVWDPVEERFIVDPEVGLLDPLDRMGAGALARWIRDWCDEVEHLGGSRPLVYLSKGYAEALAPYLADRHNLWVAAISDPPGQPDTRAWEAWHIHQYDLLGVIDPGIGDFVDFNVMVGPLADRVMKPARLAARGRLDVSGGRAMVEVAGAMSGRVSVRHSPDLEQWFDLTDLRLVNGFGEFRHEPAEPGAAHFFRTRP